MKVYRRLASAARSRKKRFIAIGIFDGMHRAHRRILCRARDAAKRHGGFSTAITFHPHPQKVLSGRRACPPILMSLEHRLHTLAGLGLDETLILPFTRRFSRVTHETFFTRDLVKGLGMRMLAVGHDFRFGRGARGDAAYLRSQARRLGLEVFICPPMKYKRHVISSTAIRRAIESGDLRKAEAMLGRPVSVYGTVVRGHGWGRKLGFPTANIDPHHETLPPDGVYAVRGTLGRRALRGVLHIGKRATFGGRDKSVEAHIFGLRQGLYGREIEFFFVRRLRATRRFAGPAELASAIARDVRTAHKLLAARR